MASNPHSDFTTHIRTLPTLSNLQLSPHLSLTLPALVSLGHGKSCGDPTPLADLKSFHPDVHGRALESASLA